MTTYTFQQLKDLWVQAGGSPTYADMAAAVATAESGGRSDAINSNNTNGSIDRGLWQINSVHGGLSTTDVMSNARAAVQISKGGTDWRPWCVAWSNGACGGTFMGTGAPVLKFLPGGSTNTGILPTAGDSNNMVLAANITPLTSALGTIFGWLGFTSPEDAAAKVGRQFLRYAYWSSLILGGVFFMSFGMILLILSTRIPQAVAGEVGRTYLGARVTARGFMDEDRRQYGGEPLPAPVSAPPMSAPPASAPPAPFLSTPAPKVKPYSGRHQMMTEPDQKGGFYRRGSTGRPPTKRARPAVRNRDFLDPDELPRSKDYIPRHGGG